MAEPRESERRLAALATTLLDETSEHSEAESKRLGALHGLVPQALVDETMTVANLYLELVQTLPVGE